MHSFEGVALGERARQAGRNLVRYVDDALSFDGWPPTGDTIRLQFALKKPLRAAANTLDMQPEDTLPGRPRFDPHKMPVAHEDLSSLGLLGWLLLWPTILVVLVHPRSRTGLRVLAVPAVLFILIEAARGPYDPWRGRYFTALAVLAAPLLGLWLQRRRPLPLQLLLIVVVSLGSVAGVGAVVLRHDAPLVTLPPDRTGPQWGHNRRSIWSLDRIGQLTRSTDSADLFRRLERHLPRDATVALFLPPNFFEYPLFGPGLTRRLIPLNSFHRGPQPIPPEADYLVYNVGLARYLENRGVSVPAELSYQDGDVMILGEIFVRALRETAPAHQSSLSRSSTASSSRSASRTSPMTASSGR